LPFHIDQIDSLSLAYALFNQMQLGESRMVNSVRMALNQMGYNFPTTGDSSYAHFSTAELNAINGVNAKTLKDLFLSIQETKFNNLYQQNPSKNGVYIKGWINRINAVRKGKGC